ncbi:type II secretion system minor pseudopilin GspK [Bathymodiolus heckerae thiotrophic gill symbiont]|uniref:type II secretion system minor pseudopilin GspK n=1 Tax=Bathymodiolus heckerae thiotrophic gill symbiont TaxID=1052212 RepID=UPI0014852679|nr:type II secretion system minor pseudopilin GspK [Bathymodiolus heckerae thiotrophic gill symbiont]
MQKSHEKGVVLVSVLVIVAMITLAVNLMWQQQALSLKNTKNSVYTNQAINYLYSIETWVRSILKEDEDKKVDDLSEDWAKKIPPISVPNGTINGTIVDFQARFNINDTFKFKDNQANIVPKYSRILNTLNTVLDQDFMVDLILEYINNHSLLQGFEHISQLKLVEGITLKDYLTIEPYIYASTSIKTKVNINTAEKKMIAALYPDLSLSSAEMIAEKRPFNSLKEAYRAIHQALSGLTLEQVKTVFSPLIDIKSSYFLLKADVNINDTHIKAQTLFSRHEKTLSVISRTYRQVLDTQLNSTSNKDSAVIEAELYISK